MSQSQAINFEEFLATEADDKEQIKAGKFKSFTDEEWEKFIAEQNLS